jgi:phosphatidylglycerol:prolipoprotein diacylglycerol transferase
MIPYFQITQFNIGPISIQVWGLMVALGFLIGAFASSWMLKRRGLQTQVVWDLLSWVVVGSIICARLFHVLLYEPNYYFTNPIEIVAIWHGGLSMIGGLIGAAVAGVWFFRRRKLDVWKYADACIFGLPLGYAIGRIGCFLIHDHPGTATDFFFGVKYSDGVVRHDLGLYHAIDGVVLFLLFLILVKKKAPTGVYVVTFLIWYGTTRFLLDFLRATSGPIVDTRYFGFTPTQYLSLAMVGMGLYFWKTRLTLKKRPS